MIAENPLILARRICASIQGTKTNVSTETSAHEDIRTLLERNGHEPQSEVRLDIRNRIDLLVNTVGIEVKVQGSRRAIWAQLCRYAQFDEIDVLVLATSVAWPADLNYAGVNKTPLFVASLSRGWL